MLSLLLKAQLTMYYPGCGAIAPPTCSDCPPKELGGIRSVWFQKESFAFSDITDPTEWAAAICSGDIYILPKTRGSLEMAEQVETGFGDIPQELNSYDFTLNFFDPNLIGSCTFYNDIKRSSQFLVGWRTESKIWMSTRQVLIVPKMPIAEDIKSRVLYNVMVKFSQEDLPCPLAIPVGTFDLCIGC